jgi:hypothetical protein
VRQVALGDTVGPPLAYIGVERRMAIAVQVPLADLGQRDPMALDL